MNFDIFLPRITLVFTFAQNTTIFAKMFAMKEEIWYTALVDK